MFKKHEVLLIADPDFHDQLYVLIEAFAKSVKYYPPLKDEVTPTANGKEYRIATIEQNGACIDVWPGPGHQSSKSPLHGKLTIWIRPLRTKVDKQRAIDLMIALSNRLEESGAEVLFSSLKK